MTKRLCDIAAVVAVILIIYSMFEYASVLGWSKGALMTVVMTACGWLAVQVIYPLWFGHD